MRLFELEDPNRVRLAAVTDQLKNDIENGRELPDWTVDDFLGYLQDQGINLSDDDLYDMYKNPPLNSLISNIEGDNIIIRGQQEGVDQNPDEQESQQVVKQMANKAMT
jgi:hypothetical protein